MSDELFDKIFDKYMLTSMYLNVKNSEKFCTEIENNYDEIDTINFEAEHERNRNQILILYLVVYGTASIICIIAITNIYNNISSSIILRKKEFSMLQSIGVTKKEFKNMINFESIFYSIEAIIFGTLLGIIINIFIWFIINKFEEISIFIPYSTIIIINALVFIFVNFIEKRITKKVCLNNIIDNIKNENI